MNVDQCDRHPHLLAEMAAIRELVGAGKPMLGICLGAQLLAAAMGGDVRPNHVPEIGWYRLHTLQSAHEDRLFRHFERHPHYVFQWHAYTFAPPPGAVPLAVDAQLPQPGLPAGRERVGTAVPPGGPDAGA